MLCTAAIAVTVALTAELTADAAFATHVAGRRDLCSAGVDRRHYAAAVDPPSRRALDRLALQLPQLPAHLGQLAAGGLLDLLLALGRGGNADHAAAVGHVVGDAGLAPSTARSPMWT